MSKSKAWRDVTVVSVRVNEFSNMTPAEKRTVVRFLRGVADEIQAANPKDHKATMRWSLKK